jgi:pimeloyl-ACP methyl ester carboxylesterase
VLAAPQSLFGSTCLLVLAVLIVAAAGVYMVFARDLSSARARAELLDHLGIDEAVVVGISAGAWSSMQFAIRHPQRCRALVLIVPADYLPEGTAVHGGASADAGEKARVGQLLDHLLPVSPRYEGMQFDIHTAAIREPYSIEKITCPVLTISAEDDRFGTAARARYIANGVAHGRALIFRCKRGATDACAQSTGRPLLSRAQFNIPWESLTR